MNIPNTLTVLRIVLAPIFLAAFYLPLPGRCLLAAALFAAAGFTDFLDGKIARKHGLVTTLGKLADPIADKMLTTAAFLAFLSTGWCNVWVVMIVLTREFAVSGLRLVAAAQNVVIAANIWGKIKTAAQIASVLLVLLLAQFFASAAFFLPVAHILMWLCATLTLLSGLTYVKSAAKILFTA
jgi:CDP-diacylglycerol--glycerol-3-phosphate 3-phosphatidyltransferase